MPPGLLLCQEQGARLPLWGPASGKPSRVLLLLLAPAASPKPRVLPSIPTAPTHAARCPDKTQTRTCLKLRGQGLQTRARAQAQPSSLLSSHSSEKLVSLLLSPDTHKPLKLKQNHLQAAGHWLDLFLKPAEMKPSRKPLAEGKPATRLRHSPEPRQPPAPTVGLRNPQPTATLCSSQPQPPAFLLSVPPAAPRCNRF